MHRTIDIELVTKIEYAIFPTEADMFLYEIYYINKFKPPLNIDDKAVDELTVSLPIVEFSVYECHLWEKWRDRIKTNNDEYLKKRNRLSSIWNETKIIKDKARQNKITEKERDILCEKLEKEQLELRKHLYD